MTSVLFPLFLVILIWGIIYFFVPNLREHTCLQNSGGNFLIFHERMLTTGKFSTHSRRKNKLWAEKDHWNTDVDLQRSFSEILREATDKAFKKQQSENSTIQDVSLAISNFRSSPINLFSFYHSFLLFSSFFSLSELLKLLKNFFFPWVRNRKKNNTR